MTDIQEILTPTSPTLPDYCQLGGRLFIVNGDRINKVVMHEQGDWRPMGAREQSAAMNPVFTEDEQGGLHYGDPVTYALRRVVTANGVTVNGGLLVEYRQCPVEKIEGAASTFRKKVTVRKTVELEGVMTTAQTVTVYAWDGSVTKTVTELTGDDADPSAGETTEEEQPTLAASITVLPYEYTTTDHCVITYEIYRSKADSAELLYKVATLTQEEVEALAEHSYTDHSTDETLGTSPAIDLASDGWDMTIPCCRYVRAWKGALVCGGSYRAIHPVTGTEGSDTVTSTVPFAADDIGCFLSIQGEPYTYQITAVDSNGAATLDHDVTSSFADAEAERYRDDDVVYISRPLPDNIEVYSAENGRLLTNHGSGNVITGIAVCGMYGYIFRENTVEILTGTPESPELTEHPAAPPGCRSHATIADMASPAVIYYAGRNGVWMLQGTEGRRISAAVDPVLTDGVDHSQDEYCHAVYDPARQMYWLFVFSTSWQDTGIRMPDMLLAYDTATGAWVRGELSASRSGLFRDVRGELRPVIGTPGGVCLLCDGDTDGDFTLVSTVVSNTADSLTLADSAADARIVPGQPVHLMRTLEDRPMTAVRRLVKSVTDSDITVYGRLPDGDFTGWRVMIGAIRWWFRTPTIGISGEFDRQLRLDAVAIAHWQAESRLPVTVIARSTGSMSDNPRDSQEWHDVFDFGRRSLSRIDGRVTGLRGTSYDVIAEGPSAPAVVRAVRVEATRVAR